MIQEEDESRQAALVLDDGPAVHGVSGQVPQLVYHGQGVRLHSHGGTRSPIKQLTVDNNKDAMTVDDGKHAGTRNDHRGARGINHHQTVK